MSKLDLSRTQRDTFLKFASLALPRHTSYPTAPHWRPDWKAEAFAGALTETVRSGTALDLYVHVPFCRNLCSYCGCTKDIVPDALRAKSDPAEAYLVGLRQEIGRIRKVTGPVTLKGVHLGGGTPTFLTPAQLARLWEIVHSHFSIAPGAELAAEIDPRSVALGQLKTLRGLGFNRLSMGIQDFDGNVQAAVNRIQPFDLVARVVDQARSLGFRSLNFDLIYGLPRQTLSSMSATLAKVVALAPGRIAFYRLAVLPDLFKWQRVFSREDMPSSELSLDLMLMATQRFQEAGYAFVGLDHFARPGDALYEAAGRESVRRSFQGMVASESERCTIGVGPSAISTLRQSFAQNDKTFKGWLRRLESGLATDRGLTLSADDQRRAEVLQSLYGSGRIDFADFVARHGASFFDVFAEQRASLEALDRHEIVRLDERQLTLTPLLGRLLTRVVAAVFDAYLPQDAWQNGLGAGAASQIG